MKNEAKMGFLIFFQNLDLGELVISSGLALGLEDWNPIKESLGSKKQVVDLPKTKTQAKGRNQAPNPKEEEREEVTSTKGNPWARNWSLINEEFTYTKC